MRRVQAALHFGGVLYHFRIGLWSCRVRQLGGAVGGNIHWAWVQGEKYSSPYQALLRRAELSLSVMIATTSTWSGA